MAMLKVLEVLA